MIQPNGHNTACHLPAAIFTLLRCSCYELQLLSGSAGSQAMCLPLLACAAAGRHLQVLLGMFLVDFAMCIHFPAFMR